MKTTVIRVAICWLALNRIAAEVETRLECHKSVWRMVEESYAGEDKATRRKLHRLWETVLSIGYLPLRKYGHFTIMPK